MFEGPPCPLLIKASSPPREVTREGIYISPLYEEDWQMPLCSIYELVLGWFNWFQWQGGANWSEGIVNQMLRLKH